MLHDAVFYQVLAGVLTAAAAGFGLWSYQLKENAEPPYRLTGEGIPTSIDLRIEMRAVAHRPMRRAALASHNGARTSL